MAGFLPGALQRKGLYVPTTDVWEVSRIQDIDVNSEEFKLLLVRLYQNINVIALALNQKDSAIYYPSEFVDGQTFFPINTYTLGTTNGAGNISGTVPGGVYKLGQQFIIGAETDVVTNPAAGAQPMTSTGPSVTHTFDITNGNYVIAGAPANTTVTFIADTFNAQLPPRNDYRFVIDIGLLDAGVTTVAHGLTIDYS